MTPLVGRLSAGVSWIDLRLLGLPQRIAAGLVLHGQGAALIDPGPTSCLARLEDGLGELGVSFDDITHVLVTHIHLDHAGAVGSIVRRVPKARVVVHGRGAGHLVDPSRLWASATMLYGDDMDRLWGRCEPVPAACIDVVEDGSVVPLSGRPMDVAYTPGHASHHVCYFDGGSGIAWVGDTAGVCVDGGYVLPPTPPPDIDLIAWQDSLARIGRWEADTLFLTHFGSVTTPAVHLGTLAANLTQVGAWALEAVEQPSLQESERQAVFEARVRRELRRAMSDERAAAYESAAAFGLMWTGLARYWRKLAKARGTPAPSAGVG